MIMARAGQDAALGIKGDGPDTTTVPCQRAQALPCVGVPQPDRLVLRRRRQHAPVGRPGDPTDPVLMPPQGAHQLHARRQRRRIPPAPYVVRVESFSLVHAPIPSHRLCPRACPRGSMACARLLGLKAVIRIGMPGIYRRA